MITNNQVALCNSLNMNFDEASELFCEESLQSMQMAKVNGGISWMGWVLKAFCANPYVGAISLTISIISGGVTLYLAFKGTEAPSDIEIGEDGVIRYKGIKVDSMKITADKKYYIWLNPSDAGATVPPTK